jgi:hypothetical protein
MEEKYQCRGEIVFVKDYYYAELKTNLKYPSLPCICLKIPEKKNLVLSLYEIGVYCGHITRLQYTIVTITETDMKGKTLLQ